MATLKQLKTFIAVAEYKKMSEAAKKLYISQPTVSQVISDLENEYHAKLFNRVSKQLEITPAGTLLLSHAREITAVSEQLEQSMKYVNSLRPLRIGATITIGNILMSSIVEQLIKTYPDIDATVIVNNTKIIEQKLLHDELDIAMAEGIIVHQDIITKPVMEDSLCLICGKNHPFASRNSITMEDLRNQNFILREKGSGTRAIFENIMLAHHIPYVVKWECSGRCAIIDAVRHNLGLGILSQQCAAEYVDKGEVASCLIEDVSMKRYFYLCHNQNRAITSQMRDFTNVVISMSDCC